jgi:hypothetical protein
MIRRQADFVFRSHGKRTFSLYAEDRSAETLRVMLPETQLFKHEDGTRSVWVLLNITEVTQ